jgi:hypothetical protein
MGACETTPPTTHTRETGPPNALPPAPIISKDRMSSRETGVIPKDSFLRSRREGVFRRQTGTRMNTRCGLAQLQVRQGPSRCLVIAGFMGWTTGQSFSEGDPAWPSL